MDLRTSLGILVFSEIALISWGSYLETSSQNSEQFALRMRELGRFGMGKTKFWVKR